MDNSQPVCGGEETSVVEPVSTKKAASVKKEPLSGSGHKALGIAAPEGQKHRPGAGSPPARPLNSTEAKEGSAQAKRSGAHQRPAPAASPATSRPINLREAKEGLTLVPPARPQRRPASRPVPLRPANPPVAKEASPKTAPVRPSAVKATLRRAALKPLKQPVAKEAAPKSAHAGPHAAESRRGSLKPLKRPEAKEGSAPVAEARPQERPVLSPATAVARDKAGRAGQEVIKKKLPKPSARAEKAAAPAESVTSAAPVAEGAKCDLYAARKVPIITIISYFLLAMVILAGWFYSGEEVLTAKEGTGYYIGIVGGVMMLLLALYPLRKTARFMRRMGAIRQWFRLHMIFGLIGPILILYHSNFSFGSLNSSVALSAMLLVAGSGLVGRYIYAGIHYGLYGREMNLVDLKKEFEDNTHGMTYVLDFAPAIRERLLRFDAKALKPHYSFAGSLVGMVMTFLSVLFLRFILAFTLRRTLRVAARRSKWLYAERKAHAQATRLYIANHISAAMAISRFKVYERLFSLWHILHMPLFIMLVLTAVIHVVAVHMF